MARLIDADELIECIQGSDDLLDFQKDECIECINACDTVYDVDKVIKELRESAIVRGMVGKTVNLSDAIEIVRQCDTVTDDVCEWSLEDEEGNLYVTKCEQ